MPILLRSLRGQANFGRGRRLSAAHKQRISQSLRQGRGRRQQQTKVRLLPHKSREHKAAYDRMQGKELARDINRLNPKMNQTIADNYVREASSSYILTQLGRERESQRDLNRVNRKYAPYFKKE